MHVVLNGLSYATRPGICNTAIVDMLNDDDTMAFYITKNKSKIDKSDVILLVNIEQKRALPVLLSEFDELVCDYERPIILSFVSFNIVETDATEFYVCDTETLSHYPNATHNRYISHTTLDGKLYISPTVSFKFDMFGVDMADMFIPDISIKNPQSFQESLFKYCNIDDNCLIVMLMHDQRVVIINKRSGNIRVYTFKDIMRNVFMGTISEANLLKAFGNVIAVNEETSSVTLTDIRYSIRLLEETKDESVTQYIMAREGDKLYIALASDECISNQCSIKDFAIESHRHAAANYEKMQIALQAFAKNLYVITTMSDVGVLSVSDEGKKSNAVDINSIYETMPNINNIGDLLRCFPVENIINGTYFNIDTKDSVRSVMTVLPKTFKVSKDPFYTVKNINFGYNSLAKVVTRANVPQNRK